jgi:hypothetical protein
VLAAVEKFYAEVVQHIKPWAPTPPKAREDEAAPPGERTEQDDPAGAPGLPASQSNQGHPLAAISTRVNGTALAWSGTEHGYLVPRCGGRIGLLGDTMPHDGAD